MDEGLARQFPSIESAHEFMVLLEETIQGVIREVDTDLKTALSEQEERRVEALRMVVYKMGVLSSHVKTSRRILNDLRSIRRLLLDERSAESTAAGS